MKCWNCLKEIPDGAKSCQYCEQKQDRQPPNPEAFKEAVEAVEATDAAEPGLAAKLKEMAGNYDTAEDFANAIMSGGCPACGSENTEDCEDVRGIENILVGRCIKCGTLFCTDCGQVFEKDVVTVSSPECPACGSGDTDYPADESDDEDGGWELQEVVTCHSCGTEYCFACGKPRAADEEAEPGNAGQNPS